MGNKLLIVLTLLCMSALPAHAENIAAAVQVKSSAIVAADKLSYADPYTLESPVHLVDGIDPLAGKNRLRVVIEIPTGTTEKWEVDKSDGNLKWEFKKGSPRIVKYLGYPGNYGMVPKTKLAEQNGGDGDPLDVLVLGPAVARGSILEVRIIGLLKMQDKGKQDDKLIAVMTGDAFDNVNSIKQLDKKYPGVSNIIETWFQNYKGQNKIKTKGFSGKGQARELVQQAMDDYESASRPAAPVEHD